MQAPQYRHETRSTTTDSHAVTITAADGTVLTGTRFGKPDAALTVVYLPGPLADATHFAPMITLIDRHLRAEVAQLVYDQRGHGNDLPLHPGPAGMAQLVEDLDTVLSQADGRVVLVVHSLAAIVAQEWLYHHRRNPAGVDAIVAITPVTELPDHDKALTEHPTGAALRAGRRLIHQLSTALGEHRLHTDAELEAARHTLRAYRRCGADLAVVEDLLRATPTWIVAGHADPVASYGRVTELAETVWAELSSLPDGGHDLARTFPQLPAAAVSSAIRVARDADRFGGQW
ncbi:alpha/beta fold hydrolase [Nocardia ignorata]|uniref:Alpha-beta hydrolase superfamily lysophospholipase n=1 Tax=Nocardia ignorata TaxID=145285 RepID=A0A4V3CMV1_NOCIG|nr:alpha/beta hydrolase [Nocardia ignorata]TDP31582.1 alpha-beta hydrolase superfamily lysophospholipase [Nocardia ignorata]